MGLSMCKPSTDTKSKGKPEDRVIDSTFLKINLQRFDEFFEEASQALEDAEEIRSGIEESEDQGAQLSHTFLLVNDPKWVDTIQVLLWAVSADNGGKIEKADVKAMHEPPFFNINKTNLNKDTYALAVIVETYFKTIEDAPKLMEDLVEKLIDLGEKTPELIEDAKNDIENSDMGFTEKLKATADILKNEAKFIKQLHKCKELKDVVFEVKKDITDMIPRLKDLILSADDIGAKAAADKLAKPSDIFDKYFPGDKKPLPPASNTPSNPPAKTPKKNTNTTKPAAPAAPTNPPAAPTQPTDNNKAPAPAPANPTNDADKSPAPAPTKPSTDNDRPASPADSEKTNDTSSHPHHQQHHHNTSGATSIGMHTGATSVGMHTGATAVGMHGSTGLHHSASAVGMHTGHHNGATAVGMHGSGLHSSVTVEFGGNTNVTVVNVSESTNAGHHHTQHHQQHHQQEHYAAF